MCSVSIQIASSLFLVVSDSIVVHTYCTKTSMGAVIELCDVFMLTIVCSYQLHCNLGRKTPHKIKLSMLSIKVAEHIYYRTEKILNPYHVLINRKGAFFSRVYPSLEEAIVGRNRFYLEHKLAGGLGEDRWSVVDVGQVQLPVGRRWWCWEGNIDNAVGDIETFYEHERTAVWCVVGLCEW